MNNEKILVSIIIPVYQAENYLDECVHSLVKQSYPDIEILLIDDGSTDNSYMKCKNWELKDNRIITFHHENKGVSYTRNIGIQNAKGKYLLFVDSDDKIDLNMLSNMVLLLERNNSDIAICGFQYDYQDYSLLKKTENYAGSYNKAEFIKLFWEIYDTNIFHCIGTKIYRSEIIKNKSLFFEEDQTYCEDVVFCIRALQLSQNITIDDHIYYYYKIRNLSSLSCQVHKNEYARKIFLLNEIEKLLDVKDRLWYMQLMQISYSHILDEVLKSNQEAKKVIFNICNNPAVCEAKVHIHKNEVSWVKWLIWKLIFDKQYRIILLTSKGINNLKYLKKVMKGKR